MTRRPFGFTRVPVPVVGLGTWQMEQDPPGAAVGALRRGLDLGLTHIDTAEMYGGGDVEELVSEAIAGRRDEVFLVSKVLPSNASRAGTVKACERSLRRLGTDRLDLYLLHWPGAHPIEDTIAAFESLVKEGKIRYWGVSNFDIADLERARAAAGPGRIACNQVLYHLGERHVEHDVIAWCEKNDIAVVAYSPFGSGEFPSSRSAGGKVLRAVADAHRATPHQVALRFLTRRTSVFAIPKSSNIAHVEENAAALSFDLTADEIARIEAAFPLGPPARPLPTI